MRIVCSDEAPRRIVPLHVSGNEIERYFIFFRVFSFFSFSLLLFLTLYRRCFNPRKRGIVLEREKRFWFNFVEFSFANENLFLNCVHQWRIQIKSWCEIVKFWNMEDLFCFFFFLIRRNIVWILDRSLDNKCLRSLRNFNYEIFYTRWYDWFRLSWTIFSGNCCAYWGANRC